MIARLHKVLLIPLVLTILFVPDASFQAQASQADMPDELMLALLAASSQPFEAADGGYHTHSGGLDFTLRAGGLQAAAEGIDWDIALSGFGRGEAIAAVSEAEIAQTDGRIEYRRGVLTEWYRDTALGVEQGFTVHQAPGGTGPIVLHLNLNTDLIGTPDADGRGLSFAAPDGQTLHYDHLLAWDAGGAELDTSLYYTPGQIALQVNDDGATYPITIDPLVYNEQKVFASGEANDHLGYSVAISDGIALVGAPADDVGTNFDQGSAYVFTRVGTIWKQQRLTASDGMSGDNFGHAVAISGDTLLVGAPYSDIGANSNQGAAYIFTRSETTWTQRAKLTAGRGAAADDQFGYSVAISGSTALVGAYHSDVGANSDQGAAYVFVNETGWIRQAKLTASQGSAEDYFGYSVAVSVNTALVGAYGDDIGTNSLQGSAYIFTRSGATWSQEGKPLTALDGEAGDCFGISVALERDTALVGAHHKNDSRGAAYVFTRSRAAWAQQAQLTASDGEAGDVFGYAVALSGGTAVVGAHYDDSHRGAAYVFTSDEKAWTQQEKLAASDGEAIDCFGISVAILGDTVLVGAHADDIGANPEQGSATIFTRRGTNWNQRWQLLANAGEPGDKFGHSVAMEGDTALVGMPDDDIGGNLNQGSVYVFVRSGATWTQQQKLTASDGAEGDWFGHSVALSGDTAVVGAYFDTVGANYAQGSAYVFARSGTTWTQQAKLTASDGATYDCFGHSVAISVDTVVVGATRADNGQGAAYAFVRSGTTWSQQAKLYASDGKVGSSFGTSVGLEGNTAVIGAPGDTIGGNSRQGSTYVFARSGTTWNQQAKLTASDGEAGDRFGSSVAISGNTVLIGAMYDDIGTHSEQGSAYIFVRNGTAWTQQAKLVASDGWPRDDFGISVALEGDTALVGSYEVGYAEGAAYVFARNGTTWSQQGKLTGSDIIWIDCFGISVALSGDTILVGADYGDVTFTYHQGTAYFYDFTVVP